ncbi:TrbI/VirB10 family protein [Rhodospirillum sp. A1_3_36]|uniref:TrbI/VirB10 family protein n=1 Tax=Rhodospirillum sp. A1_3_36 TaxID=3391666 RepID=UPI0039A65F79
MTKLDLRGGPKPRVTRFRKGVVIGGTAIAAAGVLGLALLALQAPSFRQGQTSVDLLQTGRAPTPDGLAALPGDYSEIKPEAPELGPPLPGDLGRPILAQQKAQGLMPEDAGPSEAEQRLARQAIQAREAGVFFRIEQRTPQPTKVGAGQGGQPDLSAFPVSEGSQLTLDPQRDQNNQQRKLDFLNQRDGGGIYNPHPLQTPASPYQVMAGSVIAASLITGINSDLPGLVVAQVTENVHDTVTGRILLIPQGSRLIGTYDSVVAFGQSRALLVWRRIVMPDGSSIEIDNLPATDTAGYAGLEDGVDYHTWRLVKGIALATLLGVGSELTFGEGESDLLRAIRESTQSNVNRAGQRITEKNLNIQPTITIRPGWPLQVIVQRDLVLRPYQG